MSYDARQLAEIIHANAPTGRSPNRYAADIVEAIHDALDVAKVPDGDALDRVALVLAKLAETRDQLDAAIRERDQAKRSRSEAARRLTRRGRLTFPSHRANYDAGLTLDDVVEHIGRRCDAAVDAAVDRQCDPLAALADLFTRKADQ